jgi:peptidoglycan biosynthesis protein MviN/MurJ (putative lipid II flippase)
MLFALVPLVDPLLAARQAEGTVAALSFAMRLVLGVQGLAGLGLQRACLPRLSALMIEDPLKARAFTLRWAGIAAVAGAFIGVAVAAMAEPVVTLLFEHGRFTAGNSEQVAALLRLGMLQMPPFLAGLVLVASLASAHARRQMALIAALGMGAKLLLSLALVERFGVEGLLGATALMYALTALVAGLALGKLAVMSAPAN